MMREMTWRRVAEEFFNLPSSARSEQRMAQMFEDQHKVRSERHTKRIRDLENALSHLLGCKDGARREAEVLLGREVP